MSTFLLIGIGTALCLPLFTGGSYRRLIETRWRWPLLLALGVLLQVAVERPQFDVPRNHDLGVALLIASYVLLLGFCWGNLLKRGMAVVAIGIACNFVAITVNHGMPVDVPPDWQARGGVAATVKHHPQTSSDRLTWLGDVIILRRSNEAISFGDLIMVVGLCDLTFQASRRRRRRGAAPADISLADAPVAAVSDSETLPAIVEQLEANEEASYWSLTPEPETAGRR